MFLSNLVVLVVLFVGASLSIVQLPKGFHFDIEPHTLSGFDANLDSYANQYLDLLESLGALLDDTTYLFTVDVAFWYDSRDVERQGVTRPFSEFIADRVDRLAIMAYRDWAEGARAANSTSFNGRTDSITTLSKTEMDYAMSVGKKVVVLVETKDVSPVYITFHGETTGYMEDELRKVYNYFKSNSSFDGVGMHHRNTWDALPTTYQLPRNCSDPAVFKDVFEWGIQAATNITAQTAFFAFCDVHAIRTVYMDSQTLIQSNTAALKSFLEAAYEHNVSVELLLGQPQWTFTTNHNEVLTIVQQALTFLDSLTEPSPPFEHCNNWQSHYVKL